MHTHLRPSILALICLGPGAAVGASAQEGPSVRPPAQVAAPSPDNPYRLEPFHPEFPVLLEYPNRSGLEYERSRRQALERLVANLQGNVRREAWQMAMEFFWRGPEDAVEPLVEAMDRAFGNPALGDVVKNCVEAMGKMANEGFDAALQRALEHKNPSVRQAALTALATSGKTTTLRGLFRFFPQMDARSRTAWLRGVRTRLGADAVPLLRELMMADFHTSVRDQVLKEVLLLPSAQAAEILRGRWSEAIGEFKPIIAGVLHAGGDTSGTAWLSEVLKGGDLSLLGPAIRHSAHGDVGVLRDDLLRLSSHPRADIRFEVAKVLTRVDGEDVAAVYESLAGTEEAAETRAIALRELTRRGRSQLVTAMLEELPTATGSRLQAMLNQLAQSGDVRAVSIFAERFEKAAPGEGRPFVQALALSRVDAATEAMLRLFLGPVRLVGMGAANGERHTTLNYLPTLLLNMRGSEALIVEAFGKIPPSDWLHRSALLPTIAGMASDREDPAIRDLCVPVVRRVLFDRNGPPQLRLLALNLLTRRFLTIEDAMQLKNSRHEESPQMRALFADFLNDFF